MQKTTPFFLFVGDQYGKAEEAINFYTSLFPDSSVKQMEYYITGEPGGEEGKVKHATFILAGQEYMASESSFAHQFTFSPAISIYVNCQTETEIDSLYQKLSEGGSEMMPLGNYGFSKKFGWVADKYGVNWQVNLAT